MDSRVRREASRRWGLVFVTLILLATAFTRWSTLDQPLQERHGFRQTQTAFTAKEFHEHGISLWHPLTPILGSKGEVPFEVPIFQAVATIPMNMGVPGDKALRMTSLVCFMVAIAFLFGFTRRVFGSRAAVLATLWFAFCPLSLFWSRTALMEYMAVAGALGMAWAWIRFREEGKRLFLVLGLLAGTVGILSKVTTAVFWILPVIAYEVAADVSLRAWLRRRLDPWLIAAAALPLILVIGWNQHADAIKSADPATRWLTSKALESWNFGTKAQRVDPANWKTIFDRMETLLFAVPVVVFVLVGAYVAARHRRPWTALTMLAICFVPQLVFFNLYAVHDYYLIAVSAQVAIVVGLVADAILARVTTWPPRTAAAIGLSVMLASSLVSTYTYWDESFDEAVAKPGLAAELAAHSSPDEIVIVEGLDWDPSVPYYADRRAQMLALGATKDKAWLRSLSSPPYRTYLLGQGITPLTNEVIGHKAWIASVAPHVLKFGDVTDPYPGDATAVVTDELPPTVGTHRGATGTVTCGGHDLGLSPSPSPGVWRWYELSNPDPIQAVTVTGALLPHRKYLGIRTTEAPTVGCPGTGSFELTTI